MLYFNSCGLAKAIKWWNQYVNRLVAYKHTPRGRTAISSGFLRTRWKINVGGVMVSYSRQVAS